MIAIRHHRPRRPGRVAALLTAAVVAGSLVQAGAATAVLPTPDDTVELAPSADAAQVHVVDDAVFFTSTPNQTTVIYRRPLTTGPSETALGDAEVVGLGVGYGSVAEHEGTIAYTRASDHRLVLRAPDGTTTVPDWGATPDVAGGVMALTDEWLLVINVAASDSGVVRLMDRDDGRAYDVRDIADIPAEYDWRYPQTVRVTDDRLLWAMAGTDNETMAQFEGLFTVALGPDGPTGDVVEIARSESYLTDPFPYAFFYPLDITGTRVMWERYDCAEGQLCTGTVQWYDAAPYTGAPQSATFEDGAYDVQGDVVVTGHGTDTATTLTWAPLTDPAGPIRTVEVGPWVRAISGSYVAHSGFDGPLLFTDASGGAVTITSSDVPQLQLTDLDWSDPFVLDVQWMVGEGIATGYPDGTFRNTAPVTREAMAAFLRRLVGVDAPACTEPPFADVATGHPFCGDIAWLAGTGVTAGWPDGTYRPGEPVSREAMAAFLYRLAHDGADAPACTSAPFADVAVGHPFCGEIAWLATTGVTTGWPDGTFRPGARIERQAMAAFLHRFSAAGLVPAG